MKRELEEYFINAGIALTACGILCMFVLIILALSGCTPRVQPIDMTPERVEQRVEDLRFPCDLCGQPAKMCEQENWYRCERCSRPKVTPKKLERQWVMR